MNKHVLYELQMVFSLGLFFLKSAVWKCNFKDLLQVTNDTCIQNILWVPVAKNRKMGREVSESCLENLLIEIVSSFCTGFYVDKPELAARRIEAIGFQVGHQLSER